MIRSDSWLQLVAGSLSGKWTSHKRRRNRNLRWLEQLEDRTLLAAPHPFDLTTLNGANGFRLDGIDPGDLSGFSVSGAGDVNGDGLDDLLVAALFADPGGRTDAGEAYVVFGPSSGSGSAFDLSTLDGTNGFRIEGVNAGDNLGHSVSGLGDFDGDGFDDIVLGADRADPSGKSSAGSSYVLFGHGGPFGAAFDLATLDGTNGFRLDGVDADDRTGFSVSAAGDVNGDGFEDLIIGAHDADPQGMNRAGESYVVFGNSGGFNPVLDLSTLNGTNGFRIDGVDPLDLTGFSVSGAGDVNGDGFDDVIVGALFADPNGNNAAGKSYVVFGKSSGFSASFDLALLDGQNGFWIEGINAGDQLGYSVSAAGDVNGDGLSDLIVAADGADPGGDAEAGVSYVVFGRTSNFAAPFQLNTLDGSNGFRIEGIDPGDRFGRSVSSAGDVNGDGIDDVIIGALQADPNGNSRAGETYVFFGQIAGFPAIVIPDALDGTNGFRIDGLDPGDQLGRSVNTAGDVNGDGFDDLIIGADGADPNGNPGAGETYIIFGGNFTGGIETQVGDTGDNTLTANQGSTNIDILIGGLGNDTLISDGGPDVLRGGEGDDLLTMSSVDFSGTRRLLGGSGFDTLSLSGAGITLDLTSVPDNRIVDIEQIDLSGTGDKTLVLNVREVLNISSHSNTLIVRRDFGDTVNIGPGWTQQPDELIGAERFEVYIQGAAVLKLQRAFLASMALSTLNGSNGFQINGIGLNNGSGHSVSGAGDVNGDGLDDLAIGAWQADPNGHPFSGETYVVFGRNGGFSGEFELFTLNGTNGFRMSGIDADDTSGYSVSSVGDFNGDGFDDLIIGAPLSDPNGVKNAGETYVVLGRSGGFPTALNLSSLDGTNGFRIDGVDENDGSGVSVSAAGDLNGDGIDDLVVGGKGADSFAGVTYVVFGMLEPLPASLDLSTLNGIDGFQLNGINPGDVSGGSVSSAGDVNGDGIDDLIIGARSADPIGILSAGETYVVFGKVGGFPTSIDLGALNGTNGFRINGIDPSDHSGVSVSGAGDINGDGFGDLIIGAYGADPNGIAEAGEAYVVFGHAGSFSSALDLKTLNGANGFQLNGLSQFDNSGNSVSGAGDVNGDGFDDVIISAVGADPNGQPHSGETYVLYGRSRDFPAVLELSGLNGANGFRLTGIDPYDSSGRSVAGAGDVNGDGFDDLIIGADGADPNGNAGAGETYVIFGGNFTGGIETQVGDADDNILSASQGTMQSDVLIGGQGNDMLISDGGADVLRGGQGDDTLVVIDTDFASTRRIVGGNGIDTLSLRTAGATLDLTMIADNRIVDIEQIDLTGSGGNLLLVSKLEVLNLSTETNVLLVRGVTGDQVDFTDTGWSRQASEVIGTETFAVLVNGNATLKVLEAVIAPFEPPQITATSGLQVYRENRPPTLLSPNAIVTDRDTPVLDGGQLTVTFLNGEAADEVEIVMFRGVETIGNDVRHQGVSVGTISSNVAGAGGGMTIDFNANATLASVTAVLNAIAFCNSLDAPVGGVRDVQYTISDGTGSISSPVVQQIDIQPQPDPPAIANLGGPVTFIEDAGPITLTTTGTLTDPDEHPDWSGAKLNVRVSRNPDSFDRLLIENQGTGAGQISANASEVFYEGAKIGDWNGGVGTNRLQINFISGSTTAAIQALIRAIQFENLIALPIVASKDVQFELTDPENFANIVIPNAILTVNMQGANDLPSLSGISATPSIYNEGGAPRTIGTGGIVTDDDYNGTGFLRVTIAAGGEINDRLTILDQGNGVNQIGVTSNQLRYSGVLIGMIAGGVGTNPLQINLNANATRAGVQAALRLIQYSNVSDNPSTVQRQFDFLFNDGDGADSNVVNAFVNVNATNDASVIANYGADVNTTTGTNVRVAQTVSITDVDSPDFAGGLFRATISSGQQAGDTLSLFNDATISVVGSDVFYLGTNIGTLSTNATSLTVLLNSNATATIVQRLGRNLEFSATTAGTRQIRYQVLDGDGGNVSTPDKNVNVA